MEVQKRIAEYIRLKGYKKRIVAQNAGIRLSRFSDIVNYKSELKADEFENICKALEVNPTEFMIDYSRKEQTG